MSNKYGKSVFTDNVMVIWSHLHKPDTKFGNPHHNVTVQLDDSLRTMLEDMQGELEAGKINGMGETKDGVKTIKFRNVLKAKDGIQTFPCVDSNAEITQAIPFGGDVCRLKLAPCKLDRDGSISFYLDGVQIIEKNDLGMAGNGFTPTDGFKDEEFTPTSVPSTPEDAPVGADLPDEEVTDIPF